MTIVERIKQQYCVEDRLNHAEQVYSFSLCFSDEISPEERQEIYNGVRDLALRPDDIEPALRLLLDKEGATLRLTAVSPIAEARGSFLFPNEKNQAAAVRWTVFGLVTGASWIESLKGRAVRARLYGAEQQTLAAALVATMARWQTGTPSPQKVLEDIVKDGTKKFVRQGPLLTNQPVREAGWEAHGYSFLPKKYRGEAHSLLRDLYGKENFMNQLERYCGFLRGTEAYQESLRTAAADFRKSMYQQPIAGLPNALHSAAEELREKILEKRGTKTPAQGEIQLAKLSPDALKSALSELDAWHQAQLTAMVQEIFLSDLLSAAENLLRDEIFSASVAIQDINHSLRNFCALPIEGNQNLPRLNFGWDSVINMENLRLSVPYSTWDGDQLFRLQLHNSGIKDVWLISPALSDAVHGTQFGADSFCVHSLSSQTVVLLTAE